MNIKEKLEFLKNYYEVNRSVGHTTLMLQGTDNTEEKLVLTHTKEFGRELGYKLEETVSWNNLNGLRGHNKPLAIDNGVMWLMLNETLEHINKLELENKK